MTEKLNIDESSPGELQHWKDFDKQHEKEALRMMGLSREYDVIESDEKEGFLKSQERINAFDDIDTSTNPRKKNSEKKRGIVSEILKKGLLPERLLKDSIVLYLGSGVDIEYLLALGSRNIILADFVLADHDVRQHIIERIKGISGKDVIIENNQITFDFDFGDGPEKASIKIIGQELASQYNENQETLLRDLNDKIPDNLGVIIKYASQGPAGSILIDESLKSKIVDGGVILEEDSISQKDVSGSAWKGIQLGKERE